MALPAFGSAEEVNRAAKKEDHSSEVGFGFGDGYDFGARKAGVVEGFRKGVPDEA
jgi:hypothetical protein